MATEFEDNYGDSEDQLIDEGLHEDTAEALNDEPASRRSALEEREAELEEEEQSKKRKRNMNLVIAALVASAVVFIGWKAMSMGSSNVMEGDPVFQGNNAYVIPDAQYAKNQTQPPVYNTQQDYHQSQPMQQPGEHGVPDQTQQHGQPELMAQDQSAGVNTQPQQSDQSIASGVASNVTGNRLAELENKLSGTIKRVDKIEDILADHERRITALQKPVSVAKPASTTPKTSSADTTAIRARQAAAIKAKQDAEKAAAEKERLAKLQRDIEHDKPVTKAEPVTVKRAKPMLVAIVPGRAFLQDQDGVRLDVALGDLVQACGSVSKIDADKAEVVAGNCVIN